MRTLQSEHKWPRRFLRLAQHVASWSKDPSTRVGAVITDPNHRIVSLGFNGFPQGVADTPERLADRDIKYKMILHAEANAILFSQRPLLHCTLYTWPMPPCGPCAAMIAQVGISRVWSISPSIEVVGRWGQDFAIKREVFDDVGITQLWMSSEELDAEP